LYLIETTAPNAALLSKHFLIRILAAVIETVVSGLVNNQLGCISTLKE
jgi:hypothetical protein